MKIGEIMITKEQIDAKITELAEAINKDYAGKEVIVIGILKGCFVFMSDLIRKLDFDVRVQFMEISSYQNGTVSQGNITIKKDIGIDIARERIFL